MMVKTKRFLGFLIIISLFCCRPATGFGKDQIQGTFKVVTIQSKYLNEARPVTVNLPEGYYNTKESYPVLYLLDGNKHIFHTAAICQYLSRVGRIQKFIIIGIKSINRFRDFTPDPIEHHSGTGNSKNFTKFLVKELIPNIEQRYRVKPYRAIFGHSYGGSYAFHLLIDQPGFFNAYVVASPNLIILKNIARKVVHQLDKGFKNPKFLHMTFGLIEGDFIKKSAEIKSILQSYTRVNFDWQIQILKDDNHSSTPHRTLYNGLERIFKEFWDFSENIKGANLIENFKILSKKLGYRVKIPLSVLVNIGNAALAKDHLDRAESIFTLLIQLYPESEWGYVCLGSVSYNRGLYKRAIGYFQKTLTINPHNAYAKDMLTELKKNR